MYKNSITNINNTTHTPEFKQKNDLESQTSRIKETSPQVSGSDKESLLENQTRSIPVQWKLRRNKPDQQNNTFWFPTPENPGNTDDYTPIPTPILKELRELQPEEKLNPKDNAKSRMEF